MDRLAHLEKFLTQDHYQISLMGMSGVGKTTLSRLLPKQTCFHYSIDYRIGTRYLNEEINDYLKYAAMQQPVLADLLRNDAIFIASNLTIDNLAPLSAYLGMVGDTKLGGLSLEEFSERLEKHRQAEIAATRDIMHFIQRAKNLYGYPNFLCDTSGSLCEVADEETWEILGKNTILVYIKSTEAMKNSLISRAVSHPKPLFYQQEFLQTAITKYLQLQNLKNCEQINPQLFAAWIFPQLIAHRLPLYAHIADKYGITLCATETANIKSEAEFINLIKSKIRSLLN